MNKKHLLNIYCDMDGVIADFNAEKNAVERFATEKGFFKNLKPMNADGMEKLIEADGKLINLFILSASPNKQADRDKLKWLKCYYPQIKRKNIIIMRCGKNKADYIKTRGILLDDYGKNCNQWRERGMVAIKIEKRNRSRCNEKYCWVRYYSR